MKLTALNPIKHNGKRIAQGEGFDADKKVAEALIAKGDAVEADKAAKPEGDQQ